MSTRPLVTKVPTSFRPLQVLTAFSLPYQVQLFVTGPAPLDEWTEQPGCPFWNVATSVKPPSAGVWTAPSATVPGDGIFYVPAAQFAIPVTCTFADDSSKNPYDNSGGNYVGGNHGHFEIKLQQLQKNIQGIPVWTEYDAQGNPLPRLSPSDNKPAEFRWWWIFTGPARPRT